MLSHYVTMSQKYKQERIQRHEFKHNHTNNKKTICVVGSGWGGYTFVKHINHSKYNVKVISPDKQFTYTPLLSKLATHGNIHITKNIEKANKQSNTNFIQDSIVDVNFKNKNIIGNNGEKYDYDYLVLAHGAIVNTFGIDGVDEHCNFLKKYDDAEKLRNKLNNLNNNARIAIIGTGPVGSELIGHLLKRNNFKFDIFAIDGLPKPLNMCSDDLSNYTMNLWKNNGVKMYFNNFVKSIDDKNISFNDFKLSYDVAVWCGGVKMNQLTKTLLGKLGISSRRGIPINQYLKVKSDTCNDVFAVGDCCDYDNNDVKLLPLAQVAAQQGEYLANEFNTDFAKNKKFNYNDNGLLCFVGDNNSVYQNKYFEIKGKITNLFGNLFHYFNTL